MSSSGVKKFLGMDFQIPRTRDIFVAVVLALGMGFIVYLISGYDYTAFWGSFWGVMGGIIAASSMPSASKDGIKTLAVCACSGLLFFVLTTVVAINLFG